MNITYAGSVQGETMAGEVQRGDLGKSEWAARKSPSWAPAVSIPGYFPPGRGALKPNRP